ncbi:MAG: glycosyl hydrolase family 8 [Nannocystaceae bacterium]
MARRMPSVRRPHSRLASFWVPWCALAASCAAGLETVDEGSGSEASEDAEASSSEDDPSTDDPGGDFGTHDSPAAVGPCPSRSPATGLLRRPFPQCIGLHGIKPNHVTAGEMNDAVAARYSDWKQKYVKSSHRFPGEAFYVEMVGTGEGAEDSVSTSEAHGYGMMIFALMAGYDPQARLYFDGMYKLFDVLRSAGEEGNMSWLVPRSEKTQDVSESASDGDMDIAYALLLADQQWGSSGDVDYKEQAIFSIDHGIRAADISFDLWTTLGDWDPDAEAGTRPSDWVLDHFRAYREVTGDSWWDGPIQTIYDLTDWIQSEYSPTTGLLPDFVRLDDDGYPEPAPYGWLDEPFVDFSENACRVPLRLAIDYGLYGDERTYHALEPVVRWAVEETQGDPSRLLDGYYLDGTPQNPAEMNFRMAYVGSMIAAATIGAEFQDYLNAGWDIYVAPPEDGTRDDNYFDDTLQLLAMLYVSGNWWAPYSSQAYSPV